MDFTIEEHNEEVHLTIIDDGDLLEFSIEEVVEEVNITIEEYHGADGIDGIDGINGEKGDKPNHEWSNTALRFENPDGTWGTYVDLKGQKGDSGGIQSVVAGDNITIDNTDPFNPIIHAEDGGTTVTKTSDLTNDGEDGINPFITLNDIPDVTVPTNTSDLVNDGADGVHPFITFAELPPGTNGQIYEIDNSLPEKIKPSDRLTTAENEIDAEIVNRALADNALQSQITTEKNRNDTQDGQISGKLNNPTTISDFSMYSNIVAVDDLGNVAKVASGTIDVISMFFDWNVRWFFPNIGTTTHAIFRTSVIVQQGAVAFHAELAINYSSSASTLAFIRGASVSHYTGLNFIFIRKFTIRTMVATQRILVGISTMYSVTNPTNVSLSTLVNTIGICMQSGNSNLFFIWNNNTGSANLQDTGWVNDTNYAYELKITGSITSIRINLMRINKTTLVKESQFIDITEYSLAGHTPIIWCIDSASTSAVTVGDFGVLSMYKGY